MGSNYYFLCIDLNMGGQCGMDLPSVVDKVKTLLCGYSSVAKCVSMFKVTGESKIIAVFNVSNVIGLERIISGLARMDNIGTKCQPVVLYEKFAMKSLGVDENLGKPCDNNVTKAKQIFWLEFNVEYHGKSSEEFLATWKREAEFALGAKASGVCLDLYKVVAERKVHLLIVMEPEDLNDLAFNLPLMKENGNNTTITTRSAQSLDDYCSRISSESI
ncbi:hypothetical protein ACF0H5_003641 [Mactra antiquata]